MSRREDPESLAIGLEMDLRRRCGLRVRRLEAGMFACVREGRSVLFLAVPSAELVSLIDRFCATQGARQPSYPVVMQLVVSLSRQAETADLVSETRRPRGGDPPRAALIAR